MSRTYIPVVLRREVAERATGLCEYCRIPEQLSFAPHEIDHIISEKHHGSTSLDNLALSCVICNKNKGSDIASIDPVAKEIVPLFHPRRGSWVDHFELQNDGMIIGRTSTGRATVRLLRLNAAQRVSERRLCIESGLM